MRTRAVLVSVVVFAVVAAACQQGSGGGGGGGEGSIWVLLPDSATSDR